MKKLYYIDLMERTLAAYSTEHIIRYFNDVKRDGLTEHGFPRLTANIGILMAHGRRADLKELFVEMMDLCCQQIPKVKAANDFSVKEVIFCLQELEKVNIVSAEKIEEWKTLLRSIDPYACYDVYTKNTEDIVYNWAAFTMVSEYMRQTFGLAGEYADFIDLQAYSQLRHLDENKMYRDPHEPMVYDLVTRGLFAILLDQGYQGKYKQVWEDALDASAEPTLLMQSVTGEIAYGGRSNQFIHNEAHLALMLEYYAKRYADKGDMYSAGLYKAAVERALENIASWLSQTPVSHVKNKFPIDSKYGCEEYAYFDKYMITVASFLYVAYRLCDDSIPAGVLDDRTARTWQSSDHFHKLFFRAGEYFAEYDYNADFHYDCNGLGRLHKKGVPSELFLSTPCPSEPSYQLDTEKPPLLAVAPGICVDGQWIYGTDDNVRHQVKKHYSSGETAFAETECVFPGGEKVTNSFTLNDDGLQIEVSGSGAIRCLLPVFRFNGREYTQITQNGNLLEVSYNGHCCCYRVSGGEFIDLKRSARNRNGHYDTFAAEGQGHLQIQVVMD